MAAGKSLTFLEFLTNYRGISSNLSCEKSKITEEVKTKQKQDVVICATVDLMSFKSFVMDRGAVGFLHLPLDRESLKESCLQLGLTLKIKNANE